MVNWTIQQQEAITARNTNLLVSAGAGSGKTAVLIQRILGRITDAAEPLDIDKLLVLTYTNAAAGEMRHRLGKALYQALADDRDNSFLQRQVALLPRAQITTLHSFCFDVLKKYFYLLDLDPKARIGNASELLLLQEDVLNQVFDKYYGIDNSPLELLLNHYNRGIDDNSIKSLILKIAEFSYSMIDSTGWLQGLLQPYAAGYIQAWLKYLTSHIQDKLEGYNKTMEFLLQAASNESHGVGAYLKNLIPEQQQIASCLKAYDWDSLMTVLSEITFARMPVISKKLEYDVKIKDMVSSYRQEIKDGIKDLQATYCLKNMTDIIEETKALYPVAQALVTLTEDYLQEWRHKKRQKRLLEFSDLEHYCLELLHNPEYGVSEQLQEEFAEIFVDEYQDINQVQEGILVAVARNSNRFMVGDIKQSIYRFRMAEPGLFAAKFSGYGNGHHGQRIDLQQNFRSQIGVLDGVNFLFRQLMVGGGTEIVYDSSAELQGGNQDEAAPINVLILDESSQESPEVLEADSQEQGENQEDLAVAEKEADVIADQIKKLVLAGKEYQNMVILLRSVKGWGSLIKERLSIQGIPCRSESEGDFYESSEVQIIHNLLKVIDNPRRSIAMAVVLHSPVVGLTLAELAEVRLALPGKTLYEAMTSCVLPKVRDFLTKLQEWRRAAKVLSVKDLLSKIYDDTGFLYLMNAFTDGDIKKANLEELLGVAGEYDGSSYGGLYGFLYFMAGGKQQQKSSAGGRVQQNAVTIMSIHRSKGLEFETVFVAGMGKRFNEEDTRKDILLHRHLGLGLRAVDLTKAIKYPTFGYQALAQKVRWEMKAEEMRVLYVAMTRAKENLFLVGTTRSLSGLLGKLSQVTNEKSAQISESLIGSQSSYLNWLLLGLIRHSDGAIAFDCCQSELLLDDSSRWHIKIVKYASTALDQEQEQAEGAKAWSTLLESCTKKGITNPEIQEKLGWEYPFYALTTIPVKWSASTLEGLEDLVPIYPDVADGSAQASHMKLEIASQVGVANHLLMSQANLQTIRETKDISGYLTKLLEELVHIGSIDSSIAELVKPDKLCDFFTSELGQSMLASDLAKVMREESFTMTLSLEEIGQLSSGFKKQFLPKLSADMESEHKIFIQGVIDLAFPQDDGWVLVDYKSGSGSNYSDEQIKEKYSLQLGLYAQAFEKICRVHVKGKFIYFLGSGKYIEI